MIEIKFKTGEVIYITPQMEDNLFLQGMNGKNTYTIEGVNSSGEPVIKTFYLSDLE